MRIRTALLASTLAAAISSATSFPSFAQTATPLAASPLAASAPTAVPALVPYSGAAIGADGKPLTGATSATFLIFKDERGGEPLFTETQTVAPDSNGLYKIQLGSTLPSGLPVDLFSSGEARWLEVQIAGQNPQPRALLASVPYAIKAADAATLGGLPASAYALAGARSAAVSSSQTAGPNANSTVTTPGGTAGYLPLFTGAATVADSQIFDSGTRVGIGTATPTATLDVVGTAIITGGLSAQGGADLGGSVNILATGNASAAAGKTSQPLAFVASSYNSSSKAAAPQIFRLQAEPTGNDTASPSGTLNLLFGSTPAETGLSIGSNGVVKFAAGQTFPGTGTLSSVGLGAPASDFTVSGSPVTGSGTLAFNWNVAPTSADTANAIVKRDANGSFSAGAITANVVGANSTLVSNGTTYLANAVGIGTTSPTELLHVNGTTRIDFGLDLGTAGSFIGLNRNIATGAIYNNSYGAYQIGQEIASTGGDFLIEQYNSAGTGIGAPFIISPTGNIGLNSVPDSTAPVSVGGNLKITTAGSGIVFPDGTLQTTAAASTATACNVSPAASDSYTALLDHFDGSTLGQVNGTVTYGPSVTGLGQSLVFSNGAWVEYPLSGWYDGGSASSSAGAIELWIKSAGSSAGGDFLTINWDNTSTPPGAGYITHLGLDAQGRFTFGGWSSVTNNPFDTPFETPHTVIPANTWTHIAYTWGPNGTNVYINGNLEATSSLNYYPALNPTVYVYLNAWGTNVLAAIDELRISTIARASLMKCAG